MARSLKFRIQEVEGLYYPSSENIGAYQLRGHCKVDLRLCFLHAVTAKLICVFVFAYRKSQFSYDVAQMMPTRVFSCPSVPLLLLWKIFC